jgi:hypothetical protein
MEKKMYDGGWSGSGEMVWGWFGRSTALHLYFSFAQRNFLKQELLVKCRSAHFNPTAATVPRCTDSGSA